MVDSHFCLHVLIFMQFPVGPKQVDTLEYVDLSPQI